MTELFEVVDVSKRFGGVHALQGASWALDPGAIHALIGPNGAGKSTMLDIACGLIPSTRGDVFFQGKKITNWRPDRISRLGVARTFQTSSMFAEMTVREHVMLGLLQGEDRTAALPGLFSIRRRSTISESADGVLSRVGLAERAADLATELAYGQRRLVEIGMCLARRPKVLLLDEPAAGLNTAEVAELKKLLREISDSGVAVLLIEHNIPLVVDVASLVVVLNFGRVIFSGSPENALRDSEVLAAYLGRGRAA